MTSAENMRAVAALRLGPKKSGVVYAFRALARLMANPDDTVQVFEIMRALDGRGSIRGFKRLVQTPEGGRIAYEHVELAHRLMDDAYLDALPPGSVGAAYREFVRGERLSAEGLAMISRQSLTEMEEPHPYAWFGRRTRDVHDIWHVLNGFGRDPVGEACVVAFAFAQTRGVAWMLIAAGTAFRARGGRQPYRRAIWQAFRIGRKAKWLLGEDYERLLREPLEAARQRLGLSPPTVYDSIPENFRAAALAR